jgi:DMSO reductase anchor subunit
LFAKEWPLILFTLLSQLAIGTFSLLVMVNGAMTADNMDLVDKIVRPGIYSTVLIMALALFFTLFHLGSPFIAYRAIMNPSSSWLSREILTSSGFFFLAGAYAYACYLGFSIPILGWIATAAGLATIYTMASIYNVTIFPSWTNINTYITFYGATFALGALGVAVCIAFNSPEAPLPATVAAILEKLLYVSGCSVIIPLLYLPTFISNLYAGNTAAIASARLLGNYSRVHIIRWLFSFIGLGLLFSAVMYQAGNGQTLTTSIIYLSAGFVFAGELIGRCIFYAMAVAIEIG